MTEMLLGIGVIAVAFMAVAYVQIRGGCGADCGSCERACSSGGATDGDDARA